ncbi:MAG: class I SAM-dependent methyltransferase, partial [Elusimicrobia bacterium]|nr:class I SAM-dependent methyltransferase [Elusimicrobiota bacterium]
AQGAGGALMENGPVRLERAARARFGRVARERLPEGLAALVLRQAWAELVVTIGSRLRFRESENARALRAYCAMSVADFEGVNARQKWANWRTIPRNLHRRLPSRPCRAVDLCSGVGDSTEVLACYLPEGSEILGLEYNSEFVERARGRIYRDAAGRPVKTEFRVQSVLEPFRDSAGRVLADASVDLVNCCGALALNFRESEIDALAGEVRRVLRAGALAAIDAPAGREGKERMIRLFARRGFEPLGSAQSCFLDRFSQICFRRRAP